MTQGIFVGHHDRTRAVSCVTKNGVVRGNNRTTHALNDARDVTNWEGLCGTPWQMVALGLKLAKKVTADKEGAGPHCQGLWLKERQRLNPEDSTSCLRTLKHGHTGGCPGCAALAWHGRATKPHNDERRERIRTIIERILMGKARMNACKDRIAETERVKERKRARVEQGAGDVPRVPGHEEQMADGEEEKQHDENRLSHVHIGKRGSETADEEQQPDKLRKTVRFEQEAPNTSPSSSTHVSLRVVRNNMGRSPCLCTIQVMWMVTSNFLRWTRSTRLMDET